MTLAATLSTAITGLRVAQQGLNVTAHNIANTNTEGYTRKVLAQEALVVAGRGAGVQPGELNRITDEFLQGEVRRQNSVAGRSEVITRFHDRIQDFLGAPGENRDLAIQLGELATAIDGFANSPESSAHALEVVNLARSLGLNLEHLAQQVQRLRADADREIGLAAREINGELQAVADLNREIGRLRNIGQDAAELVDRRDLLVRGLAEKIEISTFERDDGRLVIQTANGHGLVEEDARVLAYEPAASVSPGTVFDALTIFRKDQIDPATGQPAAGEVGNVLVSSGVRATLTPELQNDATADADQLITSRIRNGKIAGLLEARDAILPELDDQLQELAANLRFALNAAHNAGVAWPPPATLAGTRTDLGAFAGAVRSGSATVAVIDGSDGSTVAAFAVDIGGAADEADLVAQINAGLGALGTAALGAGGQLEITLADAGHGLAVNEGDSSIVVADAAGRERDFGFSHYFGLNDLIVLQRDRASDFTVRDDLRATPAKLATAQLDVAAGPPLVASLGGAGDNRAAQGLAEALRTPHQALARGGLPARGVSLTDYAGDVIAHHAILAQRASETASRDQALAQALQFRADSISGVNLDEEMTRMIQLQKAYTVAARIIGVTDEMFDELFRAAG